jgi:predicted nucleotidyltransferase
VPPLNAAMDMQDEWLRGLRSWASDNGSVRELWLFGSRATGRSRPDSDVDIALALMAATDGTDWALGNYFALHGNWKRELEAIVGRHVSLEAIVPDTPEDEAVRRCGALLWPAAAMEDEDEGLDELVEYLDAQYRALAIHEAGHAAVAHALGADVAFVEIDLATGNGGSNSCTFDDDAKNIAVCVAGCRAEHAFDARSPRSTKMGDFRAMRTLLARIPETERRAARAEGYRLADAALKANADVVLRIANALLSQRFDFNARLEREELAELFMGAGPA